MHSQRASADFADQGAASMNNKSNSKLFGAVIGQHKKTMLSLVAIIMSISSAAAQTNPKAVLLDGSDSITLGGGGGNPVTEDASNYLWAPISAVCICAGNYVDGVQAHYGRYAGKQIGSAGGGNCSLIRFPKGQYINSVDVRAGDHVDGVTFNFINNTRYNGYDGYAYGGKGGNPSVAKSSKGGYLAYIEGAGGSYVDRLRFVFAPPAFFQGFNEMPEIGPKVATAERYGCQGLSCLLPEKQSSPPPPAERYNCMVQEGSRLTNDWYTWVVNVRNGQRYTSDWVREEH